MPLRNSGKSPLSTPSYDVPGARCVLCGATTDLRFIERYAGVSGASAWVCKNAFGCAQRQMTGATS